MLPWINLEERRRTPVNNNLKERTRQWSLLYSAKISFPVHFGRSAGRAMPASVWTVYFKVPQLPSAGTGDRLKVEAGAECSTQPWGEQLLSP